MCEQQRLRSACTPTQYGKGSHFHLDSLKAVEGTCDQQRLSSWSWVFASGTKGKRKVQGVPLSQSAALPRPQEEEETDKSKQAQPEQTYEKH